MKKVLWDNVKALMVERWGAENLNRLAREAGFGPATASRLKEQETSVGIDVVEKCAKLFKVPPAVLLMPLDDKRLLTIAEVFRVVPEARVYLFYTAKAILEKHERDQDSKGKRA